MALLLPAALMLLATPAAGGEKARPRAVDPDVVLEQFLQQSRQFVYRREGRPDPFFPFLTKKILQAEAEARKELTGMRRFEPGQLTLVAIVFTEQAPVAMVQDAAGVGYLIRKGTKIGRAGEVMAIVPNKVIIREQVFSLTRRKQYRTVEMVLKKEGDKQ